MQEMFKRNIGGIRDEAEAMQKGAVANGAAESTDKIDRPEKVGEQELAKVRKILGMIAEGAEVPDEEKVGKEYD